LREKQKSHRTVHKNTSCTKPELLTWIPIMQTPVEKLCPESGKVLECFTTADAAVRSVAGTHYQQNFHLTLLGRYQGNSRFFKGFFWRLKGTSHLPRGIASSQNRSTFNG
jgi:hypothetical protein